MRVHVPKRIRLGLPQRPHGRPAQRLFSWQREWLERRNALAMEAATMAHNARVAELESRPATSLVDLMDIRLSIAESSLRLALEASLCFGVELSDMPRHPPEAG